MPVNGTDFTVNHYMLKEPFCSFLPGIAGERGIPLWCFYVSRGQGICSFGRENKAGAIMEFYPAHQAYRNTAITGFRTFMKVNGRYTEPFADADRPHSMTAGMNDLSLCYEDSENGIRERVTYFILPGERLGALVRKTEICNISSGKEEIELLDGAPELIPYGMNLFAIKEMTQTAKAWQQADTSREGISFFAARASMEDNSDVNEVTGTRFAFACREDGTPLHVYADPRHIFGCDSAMRAARGFRDTPFDAWKKQAECLQNLLPAAFMADSFTLLPGESRVMYMMIGEAESRERALLLHQKLMNGKTLEEKHREARLLTQELTARAACETASPVFDAYCRQAYLDNLLRGGVPRALPGGKMTYLYSRKHGDPERDYNDFRVRAEYFSQGNGNFRDVNQNRRSDVLFDPETGDRNIRLFMDLLQADGYNPLVVECIAFTLSGGDRERLLALVREEDRAYYDRLLSAPFTAGALMMAAEDHPPLSGSPEDFFGRVLALSEQTVSASFGEGYWCDHWTYDLDQIESYLGVFPEKEEELLFGDEGYTWYESGVRILPRRLRYRETARGLRQHAYLENTGLPFGKNVLCDRNGNILHATLFEKLVTLCVLKAATPDIGGIGIEMEGGKPGWYDALNGLPGLLGSGVSESCETVRLCAWLLERCEKYGRGVSLLEEAAELFYRASEVLSSGADALERWNRLSDIREDYREKLKNGLSGEKETVPVSALADFLARARNGLEAALRAAKEENGGLYPTYFAYRVTDYEKDESGIRVTKAERVRMPDFLEGQVRAMKLGLTAEQREALADSVKNSALWDRKLEMYKVNADLASASFEIGRAHAFTPGWLENESVFTHMAYKYLLEELRGGLYERFARDIKTQLVPFMDENVYGRSLLENSSFIASSANPDPVIHGKGFVCRLSGSTAEFLSMWHIMMHGEKPFCAEEGQLVFRPRPVLPAVLTEGRNEISCVLFANTRLCYRVTPGRDHFPGGYDTGSITVLFRDGTRQEYTGSVPGTGAERIRRGEAKEIRVELIMKA